MSYHLAPIANQQQSDANGNPLSGGKVNTYVAGTSTPATTYTDDTGGTAQANPIVLNSRGLPASPVWLQDGRSYKFVITDASDVVLQTIDDITGINDLTSGVDQWVTYQNEPTYINATSFSVEGDQTGTFQANRRIRSANTGGTVYSSISASTYDIVTGLTTVTVTNDSGSLDSGLASVSYGLLSNTNPSIPETAGAKKLRTLAVAGVIDRAYAEYTANADITTVIPGDDTIPQNTEGTQVLSVSLTPKSTTSRVRLRFQGEAAPSVTASIGAALFSSASANALRASFVTVQAGQAGTLALEYEYAPGTTSALTFSVRVGPLAAATVRMNGTNAARFFGGAMGATLVVEEIAA